MKVSFFNPFLGIIETNNAPHARTKRTSLGTKFKDAFAVLHGSKENVGLFDYASLFIAAVALEWLRWCIDNKDNNKLAAWLMLPAAIVNIPLYIVRLVVCAVATLITAPVTLAVSAIANFLNAQTQEEALSIKGETPSGSYYTLQRFLAENDIDVEDLRAGIHTDEAKTKHLILSHKIVTDGKTEYVPIKNFDIKLNSLHQKHSLSAFFKLNMGQIVHNLENNPNTANNADKIFASIVNPAP
ncbi:hypothetical protein [Legionella brunensis]|uniref:Transmembrane protein n=1 Tax=Legionella brunensis TaxID=29422 RepID=A0A0W0S0B1_9GAMM|nr:hypothetical protein [Legionella brunensis]KTC76834.1 hypothetical protein Lbru_2941 [Legionella brunensis]